MTLTNLMYSEKCRASMQFGVRGWGGGADGAGAAMLHRHTSRHALVANALVVGWVRRATRVFARRCAYICRPGKPGEARGETDPYDEMGRASWYDAQGPLKIRWTTSGRARPTRGENKRSAGWTDDGLGERELGELPLDGAQHAPSCTDAGAGPTTNDEYHGSTGRHTAWHALAHDIPRVIQYLLFPWLS